MISMADIGGVMKFGAKKGVSLSCKKIRKWHRYQKNIAERIDKQGKEIISEGAQVILKKIKTGVPRVSDKTE